ncbi:MAG: glycoside hydrolase family 57 protein [Bacteroidales bacterium]|nr:glycoside hydrolase family 57 protein [Bacteroidales bacterium]
MKNICFYFQVHQPFRLKHYRFFNVGHDHYYYDDYLNKHILKKVALRSYLPTNELLLKLIQESKGQFKITFSMTGILLEQLELYAPEVIEGFKKLADTGQVEFLSETYSHSLVALSNPDEFKSQVNLHREKIRSLFGKDPQVFRNTELVYSDAVGEMVHKMGFKAMLAEGAKHALGWKSPNYMYYNVLTPKLKVLLRNYKLSDDIAFRFNDRSWSEWPLTADKYLEWLASLPEEEKFVNLFMDYETFGEHQPVESGIHQFLQTLVERVLAHPGLGFTTPSDIASKYQPVAPLSVPYPSSWADEERDLSAWLGNEMQKEAFNKLYSMTALVSQTQDENLIRDWAYLQASDHFYYMSTKMFSDQSVHNYFNPYNNPYDAFINYMNVLTDFIMRIEKQSNRLKYKGIPLEELAGPTLDEALGEYELALRMLRKKRNHEKKNLQKKDPVQTETENPKPSPSPAKRKGK